MTRRRLAATVALILALTSALTGSSRAAPAGEWSWPLGGTPSVVRGFQPPPRPWLAGHRGVDLLASPGAPVLAAGAGRVTFAGWVGGMPAVAVTHPDGRRTTYEPVLAAVVRGEAVARGAILGRVSAGGSHCLPRVCLHWGLRLGDSYLDPLSLVGGAVSEVRLLPLWSAYPEAFARPSSRMVQQSIASSCRCEPVQGSRASVARTASSESASTTSSTRGPPSTGPPRTMNPVSTSRSM